MVLTLDAGLSTLEARAARAHIALILFMALAGVSIGVTICEYGGLIDFDAAELDRPSTAAGLSLAAYIITMVATTIIVATWIYRAHANLRDAGIGDLKFSPGWAVGWYFIPIANLFKPFQAMRELREASLTGRPGNGGTDSGNLPVWWGAWIVGSMASNASLRLGDRNDQAFARLTSFLDIVSDLSFIASAWLLLQIIREVSQAQQTSLRAASTFA
ncbi:hypothetical protein B2G71_05385 [Novosphingobium sp. PC22D]|uniref:DUF4328 domain-containing protein n=1 Tax=Novosphingobium sp. PC22D TaxID=1962403 RepID=UPI000BF038D6|nr:DUF4328 domain-containing protein [Novosphingobium sp. PC22D]PEQ13749.1 hypothetical protein B2G71_05385 [Novosphingobium sp. PC22D]